MTNRLPLVGAFILIATVAACAFASQPQTSAPSTAPATQPQTLARSGPVDQSLAEKTLDQSPRHGEWIDIELPEAKIKLKTWIVYPERSDKAPVVIVIHEIFGMTDWVRATADQLAAEGFIAIAPDLLSGMGKDGGATESMEGGEVREKIRQLQDDEVVKRLNATREYALALPSAGTTSAAIGFCWGGSATFKYAAAQPKLDAAVVFYGTAPMKENKPDKDALSKIQAPLLGLYGGNDARVTSTVEATAQAMKELQKEFTPHIYEGAGHGFVRQQLGTISANSDAAKIAWRETIDFLRTNLESSE
jgi:carboxymethylenebutenolidase